MVAGHLQTKKNHYYMVLYVKDQYGKKRPKWIATGIPVGGARNQKAAEDMLLETRYSYKDEVPRVDKSMAFYIPNNVLFADYMQKWLSIVKNSVEEDTYAGYKTNVEKRITPYFRKTGVMLSEITALDIEMFYEYCFSNLGLKGITVQHYHANIHTAMKYAVRHDLIQTNPMEKVERPKSQKYIGSFYSLEELETLFEAAKGDPLEFPILMSAFYGLRRSEIVGLKWQAIDFDSNSLTVSHVVIQTQSDDGIKLIGKDRAKSKSSCRSLPLVPQYRALLLRMKERQAYYRTLCGNSYIDSDYIFVNPMGVLYTPNYVSTHFKLLLQKNGLRQIRFHDLRHTCASLLLKNGVSMRDIQAWLGHSHYSTTAEIYAHLESSSKDISAAKFDKVIRIDPSLPLEGQKSTLALPDRVQAC